MKRRRGKIAWNCCKLGKASDTFGRVLRSNINKIFSRTHFCWLHQPLPSNADDHSLPWTTWRMARFKCRMTALMSTAPSSLSKRLCSNILRMGSFEGCKAVCVTRLEQPSCSCRDENNPYVPSRQCSQEALAHVCRACIQ